MTEANSVKTFIDQFRAFLLGDGNFLKLGEGYAPALYIIVFGILGVILAFIIAVISKNAGRSSKFRKQLDDATAYVEATGTIDEENVGGLNQKIQQMPDSVSKGWGNFLEQQTGYPSDYITKQDVLGETKDNPNYNSGWGVFNFFAILTVLLCWGVAALGCGNLLFEYPAHLEKSAVVVGYLLPILGTLIIPLIVYLIFYTVLNSVIKKSNKKLATSFSAFQDVLDNNIIIFREPNDEFIEENIEEINSAIEDILANKLGQNDILEIVTTPEIDKSLLIEDEQEIPLVDEEPWVDEEPIPEVAPIVAKEEPVAAPVETEEERAQRLGERLVQLVFLADAASKDPDITEQEFVDLRNFLAEVKDSGDYPSVDEQDIFNSCLIILDGAYEVRFAKKEEPVKEIVEEPVKEIVEEPVAEVIEEPVVEVVEEPVAEVVEEPAEEIVEEVATEPVETEEERKARERGERLVQLVFLADAASKDPEITVEQFKELRDFLAQAQNSGEYPSDEEQEIFNSCLFILDSAFEARFGEKNKVEKTEDVKVEEIVEEPVAEVIEEPIVEVVEEPVEEVVEEPIVEVVEEPVEEVVEEPIVEVVEEPVEEVVEEPVIEKTEVEETSEELAVEDIQESGEIIEEAKEESVAEETQETTEEVIADEEVEESAKEDTGKKKRGFFGRKKDK